MAYEDKTLECADCGLNFTFSAGEQEFFDSKGFTNEPKRCPECRQANKQRRRGYDSDGYQRPREMHDAVCSACGKDTQVPFEPRNGRPVYCNECFANVDR